MQSRTRRQTPSWAGGSQRRRVANDPDFQPLLAASSAPNPNHPRRPTATAHNRVGSYPADRGSIAVSSRGRRSVSAAQTNRSTLFDDGDSGKPTSTRSSVSLWDADAGGDGVEARPLLLPSSSTSSSRPLDDGGATAAAQRYRRDPSRVQFAHVPRQSRARRGGMTSTTTRRSASAIAADPYVRTIVATGGRRTISGGNLGGIVCDGNPVHDQVGQPMCSHGFCCVRCIRTNEIGIEETFGKFQRLLHPGPSCLAWPCSTVAGILSLRVQQLDVTCETKTRDNVFVSLSVAVQFRVIAERAYDAHYRLTDARRQIKSYVFDVIRSSVPTLNVDDLFASKSDVAVEVQRSLQGMMYEYGYEIVTSLITDVAPTDPAVKASMNEINASKRLKEAMPHRAEAEKVKQVKAAEAEAETSYLDGVGVAKKRGAIVVGMKESVADLAPHERINPKDVMDVLLISQYLDTLSAIGSSSVVIRHDPGEVMDVRDQLSSYFLPGSIESLGPIDGGGVIPDLLW